MKKRLIAGYSELLMHCKASGKEILAWNKDGRGWGFIVLDGESIGQKIEGWINYSEHDDKIYISVS